jgi:hypothetical protein
MIDHESVKQENQENQTFIRVFDFSPFRIEKFNSSGPSGLEIEVSDERNEYGKD